MDTNLAAWMIAGGPRIELASERREREQLHAYLDSKRMAEAQPGLLDRIRALVRSAPAPAACTDPASCPA